jgi:hypothetical protein
VQFGKCPLSARLGFMSKKWERFMRHFDVNYSLQTIV